VTSNKYNVHLSDFAVGKINANVAFLANVNISASDRLRKKIYKSITTLSVKPYQWPIYIKEETTKIYHSMLISKRYIILYTIEESQHRVSIQDVWDTRMDNHI
jgi:hypothetical protein